MNEKADRGSPVLLAAAAAMGLTLVALVVWSAMSQNLYGIVATIEAYDPVDGAELWTAQFDVDSAPRFTSEAVLLASDGNGIAVDGDGETREWEGDYPAVGQSGESDTAVERMMRLGGLLVTPVTSDLPGVKGSWIVLPSEGPTESLASIGKELATIGGPVRYFRVDKQTFAVDAASHEVLWTDSRRFPAAATGGLAAIKHKKRYTIISAATGNKIAVIPRDGHSPILAAGERLVIGTEAKLVVVEPDGTTRELSAPRGVLEAASAQYAVFSEVTDSRSGSVRVTVMDIATGATVLEQPFEREYGISLDGQVLAVRHWESATTADLATGAIRSARMANPRPSQPSPDIALVVFNPDATRLLWATEVSHFASVGAIDDAIVISTPAFKHR